MTYDDDDHEGGWDGNALLWVAVEIYTTSDSAVLVEEHPQPIWVPKSQVKAIVPVGHKEHVNQLERGDSTMLQIPAWLVKAKLLDRYVEDGP